MLKNIRNEMAIDCNKAIARFVGLVLLIETTALEVPQSVQNSTLADAIPTRHGAPAAWYS